MARIKVKQVAALQTTPRKPGSSDPVADADFFHWLSRTVYARMLKEGGSPPGTHRMEAKKIDANCKIYGSVLRESLSVLKDAGMLDPHVLVIPEGEAIKADDCEDGGYSYTNKKA